MNYFIDKPLQELVGDLYSAEYNNTFEPVVYNILLRYVYLNLSYHFDENPNIDGISYAALKDMINRGIEHSTEIKSQDHTFHYSLDLLSNVEIFQHIIKMPWDEFTEGVVMEVGSGFGIFFFLFNLLKEYHGLNDLEIHCFDSSEYKIGKIKKVAEYMGWKNNFLTVGNAMEGKTFKNCFNKKVNLVYSETISYENPDNFLFFEIMRAVHFGTFVKVRPLRVFPCKFIISGEEKTLHDVLRTFKSVDKSDLGDLECLEVNSIMQPVLRFICNERTEEMNDYVAKTFNNFFGFRWGIFS